MKDLLDVIDLLREDLGNASNAIRRGDLEGATKAFGQMLERIDEKLAELRS